MAKRRTKAPDVAYLDFETKPTGGYRTDEYPPKPVGASLWMPGERGPRYMAWGHPTENNTTERDARRVLQGLWKSGTEVCFHHSKFDLDVAEVHLGLPLLPWERTHDTLFLLFYEDPYSQSLGLKPAAERLLGMPPEEKDAIREWAIEQRLMPRNKKEAGEFIHLAPGGLVGRYANGDTVRTKGLFQLLYPQVVEAGMRPAYDRDRRLMPWLLANEREGVRGDLELLRADARKFCGEADGFPGGAADQVDAWIRKALRAKDLNVDSDEDLADALVRARKADEGMFLSTPKGKRSVAKDSLIGAVTDPKVLSVLQYRARLGTAKNTFLLPWLREAEHTGGVLHPSWNQVRSYDAGARTGRMSASRFMNVPKPFMEKAGKYEHPRFAGFPELPQVRRYLLPDAGEVWGKRDYAQQELRVLAHFEDGELLQRYLGDPRLDVHQLAADMLNELGHDVSRDQMKTIGFALLYGMGLAALADRLGVDVATAKSLKKLYLDLFPGLEDLDDDLKARGKAGLPLRTWGGRRYFAEPAKFSEKYGRMQSFEYKLLNYLIQGSSADCTKEAIIRYCEAKGRQGRFLVTVHDEINISVKEKLAKKEMLLLRDCMASVEFDVPMLSDGKLGRSWGELGATLDEPEYRPQVRSAA